MLKNIKTKDQVNAVIKKIDPGGACRHTKLHRCIGILRGFGSSANRDRRKIYSDYFFGAMTGCPKGKITISTTKVENILPFD
jgi:hypothetical protein